MKITINTPCHENWDGMTPNEKGAFCLSCQKNVVDFSKKTINEIKDFFSNASNSESVCGRFEEQQLTEMTFDHFFNQFKSWKYVQRAAVILIFIFGFALFGCAQTHPKDKDIIMGEVAYVPQDTIKPKCNKDTVKTTHVKGRIKTTHDLPLRKNQVNKKREEPPKSEILMGDVMIEDSKH